MFQCLTFYHGGTITFEGNQRGRITSVGKIGIHPYPSIDNVLFVEGLKHNQQSISQLCDNGYGVSFNKDECVILYDDGSLLFSAKRKGNLYKIRLDNVAPCRACKPLIFFINGVICFLKINGSRMEKEER